MNNDRSVSSLMILLGASGFALVAFAANSVLCRLALGEGRIGAADFTIIRLLSGALMLVLLNRCRKGKHPGSGSWKSAISLAVYAAGFSFAYLTLSTGTGALILFGTVQLTMIAGAFLAGERLEFLEGVGSCLAGVGLVYLVWPGVAAPSPGGAGLMAAAGIGWGVYSLRGKTAGDPLAATTGNFLRSVPLVAALFLIRQHAGVSGAGLLLASISGAVTSAIGYVIWYAAVRRMTASRAAIIQLAVPVLAALGGVAFLDEAVSLRLVIATVTVLGGIGLAIASHSAPLRTRR